MPKVTTIIFALLLSSGVAYAEDPNWNGDPEPPVEVEPEPEYPTEIGEPIIIVRPKDGDTPHVPHKQIYYSVCTCDEFKVAWGFESLELRTNKARMQCEQRRERISCPMRWK